MFFGGFFLLQFYDYISLQSIFVSGCFATVGRDTQKCPEWTGSREQIGAATFFTEPQSP